MKRKTEEERQEALRRRTKRSAQDRDKFESGTNTVLNLASLEKLNLFKPKGGRDLNVIDIVPFFITQEWYPELRMKSGQTTGLEPGDEEYKLEIPVHRRIGPDNRQVLCLKKAFGKRCPICEELQAEWDKPDSEQNDDIIAALKSSWRCYYNIYDYNDSEKDLQIWSDASYFSFEQNFLEEAESGDEYITFSSRLEGKTIEFKGKEKKLGKIVFLEAANISFQDRDQPYDESVLNETVGLDSLLIIPTYDDVNKIFLGLDEEESITSQEQEETIEKEDDQSEEKQPGRRRRATRIDKQSSTKKEDSTEIASCPSGGKIGKDCNELEACQDCPTETWEICAQLLEKIQQEISAEKVAPVEKETDTASPQRDKRTRRRARGK